MSQAKPNHNFEIGVVYRSKNQRYFLSVDKNLLIIFVHGVIVECVPKVKPSVARNINVERLCEKWGIELDDLDVVSDRYFSPIKSEKTKRRIPDKFGASQSYNQDTLNSMWAIHRTHKVVGTD